MFSLNENLNESNLIDQHFTFIYKSDWNEAKLLQYFRKQILKHSNLAANNEIKRGILPVNESYFKSFYDLNLYIQNFHFCNEYYPLYFAIALALKSSYEKHKLGKDVIIFKVFWKSPSDKNTFFGVYELPFDSCITWHDYIDTENRFEKLWTKKKTLADYDKTR